MGALLTGIKLNLSLFAANPTDQKSCNDAQQLTDEAVHEMRDIVHHLMPESLRRFGLRTAIESFCDTMPLAHFIFQGEDRRLDKHAEEAIYYIAHELVNNAAKNAHATRIDVELCQSANKTMLEVKDNGSGINPHDSGFGMDSIASRVKALGGKMEMNSTPEQGSVFKIEIPV
jgi:signal transduction histidine kinase